MKFFAILLIFYINCGESVILECNFEDDPHLGYMCDVKNEDLIISGDEREITSVSGQHQVGKTNDDVTFFFSDYRKLNFFPRGISNFFRNIKNIQVGFANIHELTSKDLEQFGGNLRQFYFYGNSLETVKADLFKFNQNLEKVSLRASKVKVIDKETFDRLTKLDGLWLSLNQCINKDATDRNEVLALIKIVEENCEN